MGNPAKLTMRLSETSRPPLFYCLRAAGIVALATLASRGQGTLCRTFQCPPGSS